MKKVAQPSDEQGPQSNAAVRRSLQEAAARIDVVLAFKASGRSAEEFSSHILKDRHSLKPSPKLLRIWAYVYDRTPTVEAFTIDNLRTEEQLLRKDAIAPITRGDPREVPGLSAEERSQQLVKEKHPLQLSANQLLALRKAYLSGGLAALKDAPRGGKGAFRGWLANPENQELLNERERRLIVTSQEQYPAATLLRVNLQRSVGSAHRDEIPSARRLDVFRRSSLGIPPGDREALAKGDRSYDAAFSPKKPTQLSQRHGDVITYDHTPSDVFVLYRGHEIRSQLTTCIDPRSGACRDVVVSATPAGSAEVALVIRGAIREKSKTEDPYQVLCGLPKRVYADRGKDMLSAHVRAALHDLGIEDTHGQGYRPYSRGSIEGNLHQLIHRRFEPELPGYVGSNAKERRPDTKAVLEFEEYAALLRHWVFTVFNHLPYTNRWLNGKRPSRLDVALDNHAPIVMPSADAMMFALLKRKTLVVQDTGVHVGGLFIYWPRFNRDLEAFTQLIHDRAKIELRYDPAAMGTTYLFRDGRFLMELHDAKAERAQAGEKDNAYFEALRARIRKETRERLRPDREAANSREDFLAYLEEQQAEAEALPVAAVAGGGRNVVRRILPLDHARRSPSPRATGAPAPRPRQSRRDEWSPWGTRQE